MKSAIFLLILLLATTIATAETITGSVQDASGAALQQSVISVQHWSVDKLGHPSPDAPIIIRPDADGRYSFHALPGVYDLFVSCPFCAGQTRQLELKRGSSAELHFKMKFGRYQKFVE